MSDTDTAPETTPESPGTPESKPAPRPPIAPSGLLQKETDRPDRPGFRNPPNQKSKAQKADKKKK